MLNFGRIVALGVLNFSNIIVSKLVGSVAALFVHVIRAFGENDFMHFYCPWCVVCFIKLCR